MKDSWQKNAFTCKQEVYADAFIELEFMKMRNNKKIIETSNGLLKYLRLINVIKTSVLHLISGINYKKFYAKKMKRYEAC